MPLPVIPRDGWWMLRSQKVDAKGDGEPLNLNGCQEGSWFIQAVGYTTCFTSESLRSLTAGSKNNMSKQVKTFELASSSVSKTT